MTTQVTFQVWNEAQQRFLQGQRTFVTRDEAIAFVGRVTHPTDGKIKHEDIISVVDLP
jgi:hypothetical protein